MTTHPDRATTPPTTPTDRPGPAQTVLVLGATGKTGRRVVDRLVADGHTVRAASRHPESVTSPAVHPVRFDWDDPTTHETALAGADALYVIPPAFVLDHVAADEALFAAARRAGVRRAVYLSARGVDADDSIPLRRAELALFASGLDASVIRPSWFAQNFTEGVFAAGILADGVVATPAGDGLEPFIDADDIAAVAARLLVSEGHDGRAYDLSGPVSLTFDEAADVLGAALGRPVRHVHLSDEEFVAGAVSAGVPADYAGMLASLLAVVRNGWDAATSDGVEVVLGRPGRSFHEWAAGLTPVAPVTPS